MSIRVLLADDDPDFLETAIASLTCADVSIVSCVSGAELLERIAEDDAFDLLITDVSMPWMSGLQVASAMREAGLVLPVIMMTGLDDASLPDRVRALGSRTTLLHKPFDAAKLKAAVSQMFPSVTWAKAS
jgi:DNA-binding response OmpR family regulator